MDTRIEIFLRYGIIALMGMGSLGVWYAILTPLTLRWVGAVLALTNTTVMEGTLITINNNISILLVPACIAAAAYYLLFILVFSTAHLSWRKRLEITLTGCLLLFALNSLRIIALISLIPFSFFEAVHWTLWNIFSVLGVMGVWFFLAFLFKINSIPFWSDAKELLALMKNKPLNNHKV